MTPEQLEHFCLLKKHLENLLETAAKRTPGEWKVYKNKSLSQFSKERIGVTPIKGCDVANTNIVGLTDDQCLSNAAFIASCAGNAEAGWRSTMASIDLLLEMERQGCSFSYFPTAESILAEWPLESLKL